MKTPMQELIDKLYKISELHVNDLPEEREYKAGLRTAAIMAEGMLEEEKKVIIDAYWDGGRFPSGVSGNDYYNETRI